MLPSSPATTESHREDDGYEEDLFPQEDLSPSSEAMKQSAIHRLPSPLPLKTSVTSPPSSHKSVAMCSSTSSFSSSSSLPHNYLSGKRMMLYQLVIVFICVSLFASFSFAFRKYTVDIPVEFQQLYNNNFFVFFAFHGE